MYSGVDGFGVVGKLDSGDRIAVPSNATLQKTCSGRRRRRQHPVRRQCGRRPVGRPEEEPEEEEEHPVNTWKTLTPGRPGRRPDTLPNTWKTWKKTCWKT